MSGEWDWLRAAAEAAPKIWLWYGGPDPTGDDVEVALSADEVRFISAAEPAVVLRVLDRLQAAERRAEMLESLLVAAKPPITAEQIEWAQQRYDESQRLIRQAGSDAGHRLYAEAADAPQAHLTAPLSASGAESDHGGRREGKGLA